METTERAVDVGQSLVAGLEEQFIVIAADGAVEVRQTARREVGVFARVECALQSEE